MIKSLLNRVCRITSIFKGIEVKEESIFFTKDYFKSEKFEIGEFTYGKPLVLFENEESNLVIGNFCSIAEEVVIFLGGNHRTDWISTYPFNVLSFFFPEAKEIEGHPSSKGSVIIGHDVWIGRGVTILSGTTIASGAVIAAGSVLSKDVGPYEVWGGNPAKFLKKRFSDDEIKTLLELEWWNWETEKINTHVDALCSGNIEKLKNV